MQNSGGDPGYGDPNMGQQPQDPYYQGNGGYGNYQGNDGQYGYDQNMDPGYQGGYPDQGYGQGDPYNDPYYGQQQMQPPPKINKQMKQQLYQMSYLNYYNQNQLQQQQQYMEQQNNYMNGLLEEQEQMKKELELQRAYAQNAHRKPHVQSREKEQNALDLLDTYAKSVKSGDYGLGGLFGGGGNKKQNDDYNPRYNNKYDYKKKYGGGPESSSSRFRNNANMIMGNNNPQSPASFNPGLSRGQNRYSQGGGMNNYNSQPNYGGGGYNQQDQYYPQQQQQQQQQSTPIDLYMNMLLQEKQQRQERRSGAESKTAELLMSSLDRQNQILAQLAQNMNKERDDKVSYEAKEIENKIKQLEFETQAKHQQLFSQNINETLSNNYNRPLPNNNVQKHEDYISGIAPNMMSAGQLAQLKGIFGGGQGGPFANLFGGGGGGGMFQKGKIPPFSVMPNQLMQQKEKIEKLKDKKKQKEKKKKQKLKEMLLLLGLEGGGGGDARARDDSSSSEEDEEDDTKRRQFEDQTKRKAEAQRKKEEKAAAKKEAEEKAKAEEEERQRQAAEQKKRNKRYLIALLWTKLFPVLYAWDFAARKELRRLQVYETILDDIFKATDHAKNWVAKSCQKGFDALLEKHKENLNIVMIGGKKVKDKDMENHCKELSRIIKIIFNDLISNTKEGNIPADLVDFLGEYTGEFTYPPQQYLFNFELQRIALTHNVSLKNVSKAQVQMLCSFFLLIRVLLAEVMFKMHTLPSVKATDILVRNIKTVCSIILFAVLDHVQHSAVVVPGNQNHLTVELKLKPRPGAIPFIVDDSIKLKDDDDGLYEQKKKVDEGAQICKDLYVKEQIKPFFEKTAIAGEIKALLKGWAQQIQELVMKKHYEKKKAEGKRVPADKLN